MFTIKVVDTSKVLTSTSYVCDTTLKEDTVTDHTARDTLLRSNTNYSEDRLLKFIEEYDRKALDRNYSLVPMMETKKDMFVIKPSVPNSNRLSQSICNFGQT